MQGPSHLVLGWFVGEAAGLPTPRLRRIVGLAGLACDVDVLAYVGAFFGFGFDLDKAFAHAHKVYHHHFTHGVGFLLLVAVVAGLYAWIRGPGQVDEFDVRPPRRGRSALAVAGLSAGVVVLHIFSDLIGSGPDWPVYPHWPLADTKWGLPWSWDLGDWPNHALLWGLLAAALVYGRYAGRTPFECIHYGLDRRIVRILQTGSDKP